MPPRTRDRAWMTKRCGGSLVHSRVGMGSALTRLLLVLRRLGCVDRLLQGREDAEDRVEMRDAEDRCHTLARSDEIEVATLGVETLQAADEDADRGRVEVLHPGQLQQDGAGALIRDAVEVLGQRAGGVPDRERPIDVEDGVGSVLLVGDLHDAAGSLPGLARPCRTSTVPPATSRPSEDTRPSKRTSGPKRAASRTSTSSVSPASGSRSTR